MIYALPAESRPTPSARQLDQWVRNARELTGGAEQRIGWVLASTVVIAALQRIHDSDRQPLFFVKGGLYLELQLGLRARTTKDIDTLFRGAIAEFEAALARTLAEPWGPFLLRPTPLKRIDKARRIAKPYRFDVRLVVKGATWRRVQVEVSFPEGRIGEYFALIPAPTEIGYFGVETPNEIVGIAMDYQVAQKMHACSDPDIPPDFFNDRVRDIVDLILMKENFYAANPVPSTLRAACLDVFASRAEEALVIGETPRHWPPVFAANARWAETYPSVAAQVGMDYTIDDAIAIVKNWVEAIHAGS
ncbi:MAG: nucleotidyl transferase AbiEii/AbiGii toxin family protein [Propionibacteriaceae bacterium]|jgi:hypothetical protein|nr:nucleotidyl transferase AbiEii/AbiGii toxin family protein [Propionibacteriaceae bacterium]